jgi:hypothetical protein
LRTLIVLVAMILASTVPAQDDGSGSAIAGGEVTAVYRGTGEIQKSEPPRIASITQVDSIATPLDSLCMSLTPVSDFEVYMTVLGALESDQVTKPYLPFFSESPIIEFLPNRDSDVKRWQLIITDYLGENVRAYDGKGKPPRVMTWDGLDSRENMTRVGFPYSYIFTTWDDTGNKRNFIGESFTVYALKWDEGVDTILRIVGNRLFVANRGSLTDGGKLLLERVAEYVRHHPLSSVVVNVFSKTSDLASIRAENVRTYLAGLLIVPTDNIRIVTQVEPESVYKEDGYCQIRILASESER